MDIASSFTFELSKVVLEQVPPRVVANLPNDEELAERGRRHRHRLTQKSRSRSKVLDLDPSPALAI